MTTFNVIDSDTHVDENDATWDYLDSAEVERPSRGQFDDPKAPRDYWLIDGHTLHKAKRSDIVTKTTAATRELHDVPARLAHMDELGVDVHVIYPTLFNRGISVRPEVEQALRHSYNRWMADRTAQTNGRLRWVCLLPYGSPKEALAELRFAKDNGACGVLKKGDEELGMPVWHEDFFPIYAEAERLNMPICFHQGTGRFTTSTAAGTSPESDFIDSKAPPVNGISVALNRGLTTQFPKLRWGCVEVGASWVVLVDHIYKRRLLNRARAQRVEPVYPAQVFEPNGIYTTCEVDEDFATILQFIDEDHLLVGSDYSHADPSQELGFVRKLRELSTAGVLSPDGPRKILWDNPKAFYGL